MVVDFVLPPPFDSPSDVDGALCADLVGRRFADVEFARVAGFRPLRLDLLLPSGVSAACPVVVWIHGGAFLGGSRLRGPVTEPVCRALLSRGIAVALVEYRLSGEALFPACLHDVKAAVRWLRRFGDELGVRPQAIGAWGESAGGHLAAFLGMNSTDEAVNGTTGITGVSSDVDAAVAWYPPTDFLTMDLQAGAASAMSHDAPGSPESRLVGGPVQDHPKAAAFASPITHVSHRAAPMLLVHGRDDRAVPCRQSEALHEALSGVGCSSQLEVVPGAGHVFQGVEPAPIAERSAEFLRSRLV